MLLSLNWLKEFVPIELTPKELADLLTLSGSEVANCFELGSELEGVVVGQLTSVSPHPHADKLSLCTVDTGSAIHSVVCGAGNIKPGDKAPLALHGSTLPDGTTIKKTKIRGEVSAGMLCSQAELHLGGDQSGVMILPPGTRVGQSLPEALGLRDVMLDVSFTPNRPDCLSIIGVAREIAALTHQTLRLPSPALTETGEAVSRLTSVTIEAPDLCPRYCARIVAQVKVGPAPLWMRRRLEACGMRSINNIVDATNYILMEMGQPLHAFDLDLLHLKRIIVKRAEAGTTFTTLDGKDRILPGDALMICDGSRRPIALAGIMGGLNTEVSPATTAILLESAYFSPGGILATSRKMGIRTEASQRFEKGVDPEGVMRALTRAAMLIAECSGGTISPGCIDNHPLPASAPTAITLSTARTNRILGTALTREDISQTLRGLRFSVADVDQDRVAATPPSYRVDISAGIDLIEEVARLRGYDSIAETLPQVSPLPPLKDKGRALEKRIKDCLTQQGYHEIITYSFISPAELGNLNLSPEDRRLNALNILNPLSAEQSCLRTTLIPGLLSTAQRNINQKNLHLRLFEAGPVFLREEDRKLPREVKMVAGMLTGLYEEECWNRKPREADFYDIKGCLEHLLRQLHIVGYSFVKSRENPFFHELKALDLMIDNHRAGSCGELHPAIIDGYHLSQRIYLFEISLPHLLPRFGAQRAFQSLPKYPPVYRDMALVLDESIPALRIGEVLEQHKKNKFIEEIRIFDYYKGASIPAGKKSLGYRVRYQAYDHTLTDTEVNAWHEELVRIICTELGAELRK